MTAHSILWLYYRPGLALMALWIAWAVSWIVAMPWSSRAKERAGWRTELLYRVVLAIGGLIFAVPSSRPGQVRLWPLMSLPAVWACIFAVALGCAFSWWARIYLGDLWSGSITRKADHRVVDTGPYRIVRHPIYTGILIAVWATMVAKGTVLGLAGAVIITVGLWLKGRFEERFLREQLSADAYDAYRRRVPMLIPLGPKSA